MKYHDNKIRKNNNEGEKKAAIFSQNNTIRTEKVSGNIICNP